jgi:hypothetical protein
MQHRMPHTTRITQGRTKNESNYLLFSIITLDPLQRPVLGLLKQSISVIG